MKECCVCEKKLEPGEDFFKVKHPSGLRKFICDPCKQLLRVAFETTGRMKFTEGRLAGSKEAKNRP